MREKCPKNIEIMVEVVEPSRFSLVAYKRMQKKCRKNVSKRADRSRLEYPDCNTIFGNYLTSGSCSHFAYLIPQECEESPSCDSEQLSSK